MNAKISVFAIFVEAIILYNLHDCTLSLELLSPEIVSVSENKELLRHFRVYRVRTTSAQTDG